MNCRRARHLLFDFFDGASNEALRAEVDRHLGECEECDHFASEMTRSLALLRRVPMEPLDENFNWKVRLAIHREKNVALERAATANAWVRTWNLRYAVSGGLAIYLFGVIGMQGVALIQSERVNLFEPRQLAVGAIILITGIGGNLALKDGLFPFQIPVIFPNGIPSIVFAAIVGILMNLVFLVLPPSKFGVKERENINYE